MTKRHGSGVAQPFVLTRQHDGLGFMGKLIYPSGRVICFEADGLNRVQRIDNQAIGDQYCGDAQLPAQRLLLENDYRGLRIGKRAYGNGTTNVCVRL